MPRKFDIVAAVVTALGNIATATTPSGSSRAFRTDVQTAERGIRVFDEVNASDLPYVGVAGTDERYINEETGLYWVDLKVIIHAITAGGTPATRDAEVDAIVDDIKAALHEDPTFGQLAMWTRLDLVQTNEDQPDERHSEVWVTATIRYETDFLVTL